LQPGQTVQRKAVTSFQYDGSDDWRHTVFVRSSCWRGAGDVGCAHCGQAEGNHSSTGHCYPEATVEAAPECNAADLPF
jgi:hypothetical protein